MLKQTAAIHRAPQKLQVFLLACLVVGITPLASLASEINPNPTEDAAISLETEPTELTETSLTEDCLPTASESEQPEVEPTSEAAQVEEGGEVTAPCATAEALAEDEFADADDADTALAEEETQGSSGPAINININIGSEGPLIGIGASSNEGGFPPENDFDAVPDPDLDEPVEKGLPVIPEKTPGPKALGPTPAVKPPSKAPKGLIRRTRLQKSKASQKKRVRLKSGSRRVKRVKPRARRKLLRKQIKSNRRQIKSLGKRLRKNQRRIKSKRLRLNLRRSPARKRPLRRIKTVRPLLRRQ